MTVVLAEGMTGLKNCFLTVLQTDYDSFLLIASTLNGGRFISATELDRECIKGTFDDMGLKFDRSDLPLLDGGVLK